MPASVSNFIGLFDFNLRYKLLPIFVFILTKSASLSKYTNRIFLF